MKTYILLDRSGSMASKWDETIGAINAYVDGIKTVRKATVTLAAFDSSDKMDYRVLRDNKPVSEWGGVYSAEVSPRGGTPLFDAIGRMVADIRAADPKKATIVIITDGQENSSREVTKEAAKGLLDELRGKKYDVVFIGADFDAFGQAGALGNATANTLNMAQGSYHDAMRSMSNRTVAYASTGAAAAFSDEDRKKAAGQKV